MKTKTIVWLCGAILALYYVLMQFVPVPGYAPACSNRLAIGEIT